MLNKSAKEKKEKIQSLQTLPMDATSHEKAKHMDRQKSASWTQTQTPIHIHMHTHTNTQKIQNYRLRTYIVVKRFLVFPRIFSTYTHIFQKEADSFETIFILILVPRTQMFWCFVLKEDANQQQCPSAMRTARKIFQ